MGMKSFNFTKIKSGGGIKLFLAALMMIFIISCSSSGSGGNGGGNGGGDNPPPAPGTASITLSPNVLDFGPIAPNKPKTLPITVKNAGDTRATGLSLGALPNGFTSAGTCVETPLLNGGASCSFDITFTPTVESSFSEKVTVNSDNAGNPTFTITVEMPLKIVKMVSGVASNNFSFGYDRNDKLYTWGQNDLGQLGVGNNENKNEPTAVKVPTGVKFTDVYAGINFTFAKGDNGKLYAWGQNDLGQLGTGDNENKNEPTAVIMPAGVTFTEVYVSNDYTFAKDSDGKFYAWGNNTSLQLGVGDNENKNEPTAVVMTNVPANVTFTEVYAGNNYTFAKGSDDKLYAWGSNISGRLGVGDDVNRNIPTAVTMPAGVTSFTGVYVGGNFTIAKGSDSNLYAWGDNGGGQLGVGDTGTKNEPTAVKVPTGVKFTDVYAGIYFTFAKGDDGKLYAWGWNDAGQLGVGDENVKNVPTAVVMTNVPANVTFTEVYAGNNYTFAKGNDNKLYAWGKNDLGQLGAGTNVTLKTEPIAVVMPSGVASFTDLQIGGSSVFAKGSDGALYAWGDNGGGQLGVGNTNIQNKPKTVTLPDGVASFTGVYVSSSYTFANGSDGNLYAWGSNKFGQLGVGDLVDKNVPTKLKVIE